MTYHNVEAHGEPQSMIISDEPLATGMHIWVGWNTMIILSKKNKKRLYKPFPKGWFMALFTRLTCRSCLSCLPCLSVRGTHMSWDQKTHPGKKPSAAQRLPRWANQPGRTGYHWTWQNPIKSPKSPIQSISINKPLDYVGFTFQPMLQRFPAGFPLVHRSTCAGIHAVPWTGELPNVGSQNATNQSRVRNELQFSSTTTVHLNELEVKENCWQWFFSVAMIDSFIRIFLPHGWSFQWTETKATYRMWQDKYVSVCEFRV